MQQLRDVVKKQQEAVRKTQGGSLDHRRHLLSQLSLFLHENEEAILDALARDLGRCWLEGWTAEIGLVQADIRYALKHLKSWHRPTKMKISPVQMPGKATVQKYPYGSVLLISPWNYPVQLLLSPTIAALAAGNRVILKPSERSGAVEKILVEKLPNYFNDSELHVTTANVETIRLLIREEVDFVCFTGSTAIGRSVMADAAQQPIPVLLELGGVNPVFLEAGVDYKESAKRICWGKFFNAGQTCLAPNHIFLEKEAEVPLIKALTKTIRKFYGKNPEKSKDLGRLIDRRACDEMAAIIAQGEILLGGEINRDDRYVAPTLLKVAPDSPLLKQEIFGPILLIVVVHSLTEVIRNEPWHEAPLAVYGFGGEELERELLYYSRSGSLMFNGTIHRVVSTSQPFGGVGTSGIGNYRGRAGYDTFTYERMIVKKHPRFEMPHLTPPYKMSQKLIKWLNKYL